jgi:hypothetical protein
VNLVINRENYTPLARTRTRSVAAVLVGRQASDGRCEYGGAGAAPGLLAYVAAVVDGGGTVLGTESFSTTRAQAAGLIPDLTPWPVPPRQPTRRSARAVKVEHTAETTLTAPSTGT